nr:hypothetical protein [uncultured Pedobacter sp.]
MKTLILDLKDHKPRTFKAQNSSFSEEKKIIISQTKRKFIFFPKDAKQNLSGGACLARGLSLVLLPFLSAIDWYYGTSTLPFLIAGLFYLEVTALTAYCPIKQRLIHLNILKMKDQHIEDHQI